MCMVRETGEKLRVVEQCQELELALGLPPVSPSSRISEGAVE